MSNAVPVAAIRNGNTNLGIVWKSDGIYNTVFNNTEIKDINQGIVVHGVNLNEHEEYIDLIDIISKSINKVVK